MRTVGNRPCVLTCVLLLTPLLTTLACGEGPGREEVGFSNQALSQNEFEVSLVLPSFATAAQTVIAANGEVDLADRVVVLHDDPENPGVVTNTGTLGTTIGAQAVTGSIYSQPQVTVRSWGTVDGDVLTTMPVSFQHGGHVTGEIDDDAVFEPKKVVSWGVRYPDVSQGDVTVNGGRLLPPGRYGRVSVNSGGTLTLLTGTYYLDSLFLESAGAIRLSQAGGPVLIYLRDGFAYRGTVTALGGGPPNLLMVHLGTGTAVLERPFTGTWISPNARLILGASGSQHEGTFHAKDVWAYPDVTVKQARLTGDFDGDGLSTESEIDVYGSNPFVADTDGDGLADGAEVQYWESRDDGISWNSDVDVLGARQTTAGGDGLINLLDADSDNDGLLDGEEVEGWEMPLPGGGTEPVDADPAAHDTDGDGLTDEKERDGWNLRVRDELRHVYAHPRRADTDEDTLNDFVEANKVKSDPRVTHTFGPYYPDEDRAQNLAAAGPSVLDPPCELYANNAPENTYVTEYMVQPTISTSTADSRSVRQLYVESAMANRTFTVHFRSEEASDPNTVDPDDNFSAIEMRRPGADDFELVSAGPHAGEFVGQITPSDAAVYGFYEFRLTYHKDDDSSRYRFFAEFDADGEPVPLAWTDPDMSAHVELTFRTAGENPLYLRGGAYGDGTDESQSYITNIFLDGTKLYERSFNGADFQYPLGDLAPNDHTLTFDWAVQDSGTAKLMTHICESGVPWNPVQITYMSNMHTRDYGAWKTGVAARPGGVAVQDAVVRRGTTFMVVGRGPGLASGDAVVEIFKDGVFQHGWPTSREEMYQGRDGYFQNVEVTVPETVAIGRYTLLMRDFTGVPVAAEVPFNVIFNPYRLVDADFTKEHLQTYAYDEDEDGDDWGADADHGRDEWTAYHKYPYLTRSYELHSFARREREEDGGIVQETSVFELAIAAADGATNEFDASLRLLRLMNQRIIWGYSGWDGDDIDELLGDDYTDDPDVALTTDDALQFSRNNQDLYAEYPDKRRDGECMDFAAGLIGLARSLGIPARHVATPSAFDWSGFHAWSEVYLPATLLPKQDGKTTSGGATDSDRDPWYVFDSTDSFYDPTNETRWPHSEESIDPRVDFYASFVNNGSTVPSAIYTSRLDWCIPGSDDTCDTQTEDLEPEYSTPTEFWMSGTSGSAVSGWLSWGDKDIFRVDLASQSTVSLQSSDDLDIVFCSYNFSPADQDLYLCDNPTRSEDLAAGPWTIQVFNQSPHDGVHGGNYVQYSLQVD